MKKILLPFFLLTFCYSALSAQSLNYKTERNLSYITSPKTAYADSICRLDIYHPDSGSDYPVVVWFHGGGLTGGRKEIPSELMNQKFVVVGVGYGLYPSVPTAQCIDDAAASVAWVFKNIAKYGGDPQRIYISGHSAGGYLTTMIGLDKHWLAKYDVDADRIKALIPYSGQAITHFTTRKERGIADTQAIIDEFAPLYHVRADAPPILLLSGDREIELLGRYEENAYFWRMLKLVGHPDVELMELDGFDHGSMAKPGHLLMIKYIKDMEKRR